MTKQEIYDALKADGAKIGKAVNFISKEALEDMYRERFGVEPGETPKQQEDEPEEEVPNTHIMNDGEDVADRNVVNIKLLKFIDSGWCEALRKSYFRGLYRPETVQEYLALKPFAAEEMEIQL